MDLYDQSRTLVYSGPVIRKMRSEAGFNEWHDLVTCLLDNYRPYFLLWYVTLLKCLSVLFAKEEKHPKASSARRYLMSRVRQETSIAEPTHPLSSSPYIYHIYDSEVLLMFLTRAKRKMKRVDFWIPYVHRLCQFFLSPSTMRQAVPLVGIPCMWHLRRNARSGSPHYPT